MKTFVNGCVHYKGTFRMVHDGERYRSEKHIPSQTNRRNRRITDRWEHITFDHRSYQDAVNALIRYVTLFSN